MLRDFNALQVFVKVVQTGSFTAAARAFAMPKSTVSQRVAELEEQLGARLLQRTTRKLSLTDAGRIYHGHCVRIVAEIEEAERAVTSLQQRPRGLLRVTVPASTQFLFSSVFADFLLENDGVQLEVLSTDRLVDVVEESFDLAIRAGSLSDSTLIARSLAPISFTLVATPQYLEKRGRPRTPQALTKHACLAFLVGARPNTWRFTRAGEPTEVEVTPVLSVNDLDLVHSAAVRGVGIAILPTHRCLEDLRAGRLERVLLEWDLPTAPMHAVYPSSRYLSPKVKALLDHLHQLSPAPWELQPPAAAAVPGAAAPRAAAARRSTR